MLGVATTGRGRRVRLWRARRARGGRHVIEIGEKPVSVSRFERGDRVATRVASNSEDFSPDRDSFGERPMNGAETETRRMKSRNRESGLCHCENSEGNAMKKKSIAEPIDRSVKRKPFYGRPRRVHRSTRSTSRRFRSRQIEEVCGSRKAHRERSREAFRFLLSGFITSSRRWVVHARAARGPGTRAARSPLSGTARRRRSPPRVAALSHTEHKPPPPFVAARLAVSFIARPSRRAPLTGQRRGRSPRRRRRGRPPPACRRT